MKGLLSLAGNRQLKIVKIGAVPIFLFSLCLLATLSVAKADMSVLRLKCDGGLNMCRFKCTEKSYCILYPLLDLLQDKPKRKTGSFKYEHIDIDNLYLAVLKDQTHPEVKYLNILYEDQDSKLKNCRRAKECIVRLSRFDIGPISGTLESETFNWGKVTTRKIVLDNASLFTVVDAWDAASVPTNLDELLKSIREP